MKKIILALIVYTVSCYYINNWFEIAFSKQGRWSHQERDFGSYAFTYIPLISTVAATMAFFINPNEN